MITVAFTVSTRRPRYLRRTLESWARARGLDRTRLAFFLEPPIREFDVGAFRQWARTLPAAQVIFEVANQHFGCNRNTHRAMAAALRLSDFAVLAEEDTEVADDIVEYYEWASHAYRDDQEVMAVCAHVKESAGGEAEVARAPWFSPLGWGTWAERWEDLLEFPWRTYPDSWDAFVRTVRFENDMRCLFPLRSRTSHFGEKSTLTPARAGGAPNYFHATAQTSCFAPHYGQQPYREVPASAGLVLY